MNNRHPSPLYYQLANELRERIHTGELAAGTQLPSERDLSEQHGISRMTVRQAIAYLEREGLLIVKPGLGTFVAQQKLTYDALQLLGFTETVAPQDKAVTSTVLEQTVLPAPNSIRQELGLKEKGDVFKLVRLRKVEDVPLALETSYLPSHLCPGLEQVDLSEASLYQLLEQRHGIYLERARQSFEASVADAYHAELFGIDVGASMIWLEGVTYNQFDRPIESFSTLYRGDRFKITIESQRNNHPHVSRLPSLSLTLLEQH